MIPRGFFTLLSGGGLAQIITLLALPVLGRLYDPTAFGQLAAVMAIVSLATVLVHGRYQMAIPVAKSDYEALDLMVFATLCSAVLSFPVVTIIYLIVGRLPDGLSLWVLLLSATVLTFMSSLIDVLAYWRSHRSRFNVSAQNSVARSLTTALSQIATAATSSIGLLIGTGLGTTAAAALAIRDMIRHDSHSLRLPPFKRLRAVAFKYSSYPLFGVPQGWLAAISWNAMPLLLLRYGGTAIAGQYWIAYRLLVAPIALFNGTYRQATLPVLRERKEESARKLIALHTLWIAGASFIPLAILFFFGEQLLTFAMGSVWALAGLMASWLSVGIFADLFKIPTLCFLQSQGLQKRILIWEVGIVALRYIGAYMYLIQGDVVGAVALFSCSGFVGWLLFCVYELSPLNRHASSKREI